MEQDKIKKAISLLESVTGKKVVLKEFFFFKPKESPLPFVEQLKETIDTFLYLFYGDNKHLFNYKLKKNGNLIKLFNDYYIVKDGSILSSEMFIAEWQDFGNDLILYLNQKVHKKYKIIKISQHDMTLLSFKADTPF